MLLKKTALAITTASLALPAAISGAHLKGCNTRHCDVKWERRWIKAHPPAPRTPYRALASWYYDAGATASGSHYSLGVAHKTLRFGTRIRMCAARCATVVVQDRGPFIAGRDFDLNPGAKAALGCGDLCSIRWGYAR